MQICEYFFENACYSVTKYYLCKQNNKRSLLGRKQRHQVVRSFPNRYLFSFTNKVTSLFPISCILEIILRGNCGPFASPFGLFSAHIWASRGVDKIQMPDSQCFRNFAKTRVFAPDRSLRENIASREAEKQ